MNRFLSFYLIASALILSNCSDNAGAPIDESPAENRSSVAALSYSVVATYPHDTSSFTQGLEFYNGLLLESTGNWKSSRLMQVDLKTGKAIKSIPLRDSLFGEGITVLNDTIYQLTWQDHVVLVYSAKDFKKIKEFPINTEGWGITNNGKELIVTDGSSNLYFYEPSTFRLLRTQGVTEDGSPAMNLNELEFINGFIYANQWQYPYILKIDPNSGHVVGKMDLTQLAQRAKAANPNEQYMNGIAYNPETKKVYITGKYWPELYEISFAF
ncbi:MAG TPA: glutaminyl-peptide cyclotransferase [Flavisolibacter sp.]|nr:glutaminyl-peptide cyclotransferase [Flavisolibacter sp.]